MHSCPTRLPPMWRGGRPMLPIRRRMPGWNLFRQLGLPGLWRTWRALLCQRCVQHPWGVLPGTHMYHKISA